MLRRMLCAVVLGGLAAGGPSSAFEASWTDQFGETTYTIRGPTEVLPGSPVTIVLTASDALYPGDLVASPWRFLEDGGEFDGGFGIWLTGGSWERTLVFVYDAPGDHLFTFTGQDLGHGGGAHGWEWFAIEGVTSVTIPTPPRQESWGRIKRGFGGGTDGGGR